MQILQTPSFPSLTGLSRLWRAMGGVAAALAVGVCIRAPLAQAQNTGVVNSVDVEVEEFGTGNVARPGEWTGVRLRLRDHGDRVRNVVVQFDVPDPDGDIATHQRIVTLNTGVRSGQGVWMYPRTPFSLTRSLRFDVTIREASDSDAQNRLATGRRLGAARISPVNVINGTDSLIGVVGPRRMGLEQYAVAPSNAKNIPPTMNEFVRLAPGLTPATMPDAWMGLWQFETIVWGAADPAELRSGSRDAIANWVRRGGHLVVVLPAIGSTWTDPRVNPLYDLMPLVSVQRIDGASLERFRPLLTKSRQLPLPGRTIVHAFTPAPGASPSDATPILAGPNGAVVVVRRTVGVGAVTLVGIDIASTALLGRIDADVFWHRVLGKRGDIFTLTELQERKTASGQRINISPAFGAERLDDAIGALVNKTGRAGVGVLLGLIVFSAYVLLAGPVGFALLSRAKMRRHAWLAFVATTAVFTIIAWGGARAIRPVRAEITELTLIDHVYGQELQRVRSWMSVLVPTYGDATFAIVDDDRIATAGANALTPWDDPEETFARTFPDTRPYAVDTRNPSTLRSPSRATVKRFQLDWAGPPVLPMLQPFDGPITLDGRRGLEGILSHNLPAPLERVRVILVRRQTPLGRTRQGGPLLAVTRAWDPFPGGVWAPGALLDLSSLDAPANEGDRRNRLQTAEDYFRAVGTGSARPGAAALDLRSAPRRLEALAWAPLLEPPDWKSTALSRAPLLQRRAGQRMDIARWFTQPCLIVVGQLEDQAAVVPLSVDGRVPPSSGRAIIRWVYPLAGNPPEYQPRSAR